MSKIGVNFWSNSKTLFADVNVQDTETIKDLKNKLRNGIDVFNKNEVVIVQEKENGLFICLADTAKISEIRTKESLPLRAFPRFCQCVVKTSEIYEQRRIDVTSRVFDIVYDIIDEKPQRYIAGFQKQNESRDSSVFYPLSLTGLLCEQGWFHDTLFLIRRLYADDTTDGLIEQQAKFLVENCRMANNFSLSAYEVSTWGELAALQFLFEREAQITESYVRQNITRCVAPAVKEEEESELVEKTTFNIRRHSKISPPSALRLYLVTSVSEGCQCSYVEKVKFKVVGSPWFSSSRYIYICPESIWLTKENGFNPSEKVRIADVTGTMFDGENVIISLINKTQWAIKCSRPRVLMGYINETIKDEFKNVVDRATKERALKPSESTQELLTDNDKALAVVAPITQITSNDDFESNTSFPLFPSHNAIIRPSQFSLDDDYEPIPGMKISKRVRSLRMKPICLTKIKIPSVSEMDSDVDVNSKMLMTITLTNPVNETSSGIEEESLMPNVEEFFEYNGKEGMTSNSAMFIWIMMLYLLVHFARWLNGM